MVSGGKGFRDQGRLTRAYIGQWPMRQFQPARGRRQRAAGYGELTRELEMKKIAITIATSDYDHFRDFRSGKVRQKALILSGWTLTFTRSSRDLHYVANGT
jgi:hypothetical protein